MTPNLKTSPVEAAYRTVLVVADWECQSLRDRPAASNPSPKRYIGDADSFCPLANRHCDSIVCKQYVCPHIASLFQPSGPAAISLAVIAVHINAVNRVLWRRRQAHIRKEHLERVPFVTNQNAPPAVVFILSVSATMQHAAPRLEYAGLGHTVSPMRFGSVPSSNAPATNGRAGPKVIAVYRLDRAADATANPTWGMPGISSVLSFHNGQTSKHITNLN